jgi:hypothetical protein
VRAAIQALIGGLPLDERARRLLDETLLDWTIEADASSSLAARLSVELRSVVAIVRVLAVASVRESTAIPVAWLAGRVALFGLLCLVVQIAIFARFPGIVARQGAEVALYNGDVVLADVHFVIDYGYLAIVTLAGTLPLALFYAVAWRPAARALPIVGVASVGALLVAAYRAAILPEHLVDGRVPVSLVQRFGLDLPLVLTFVTLACMTFALAILGEAVFRTRWSRRVAILLSAAPLYFAVIFLAAMLQRFLIAALARGVWLPPRSISSMLGVPVGYAAILIASLWWARRLGASSAEGVHVTTDPC